MSELHGNRKAKTLPQAPAIAVIAGAGLAFTCCSTQSPRQRFPLLGSAGMRDVSQVVAQGWVHRIPLFRADAGLFADSDPALPFLRTCLRNSS